MQNSEQCKNKKLVLVVDDEPDIRLFLELALYEAGFYTMSAGNGLGALEILERSTPDLISLDLVMPKKNGARFLYEIRKTRKWSDIPVLIVTAHAKDEMGQGYLSHILEGRMLIGYGIYLEKPITPAKYVNCVRKMLNMPVPAEKDDPVALKNKVDELLRNADMKLLKNIIKKIESE